MGWRRRQLLISRPEKMGYRVEACIAVGQVLLVLRASSRFDAADRAGLGGTGLVARICAYAMVGTVSRPVRLPCPAESHAAKA